ncbi:MAG TPA: hypothetical protein VIN07_08375 [Flavipsychrobacter sp.]
MENYLVDKDIKVLCIAASSFPAGIQEAFSKIHDLVPNTEKRTTYGISYGSPNGSIIYKAGVEALQPGEAEEYGCEEYVIRKGRYIGRVVNWRENVAQVGETFQALLVDPLIDRTGACIEEYISDYEVKCMVRLKD